MTLSIGMITTDTLDARRLGTWWADALGGTVVEENDGWFVVVALGEGRPLLAFQKVDDPTSGKNRLHLDLQADDRTAAVADLVAAGATVIEERSMGDGFVWTTLADPDGNEFCVATH
ncbi:VOC family protein [Gordonia hydrophobica]|uniref:VOC family protein n=1 Tax=Gordonia hydrophobica TaxID=40516 RepID=A0ABZ2U216_9ACTN|nr:VOC family protein [Gordonia hydrophobica]MBM7369479.1 putative enzyme related to lactoylglutathione lyase [Gordonia hydrophobica]